MKNKSPAVQLYHEVNRLRKKDGLESISLLYFAHKVSMFHEDRNPRVAEALSNLGMPEPGKKSR